MSALRLILLCMVGSAPTTPSRAKASADDDTEWLPTTPGGSRRRTRSADATKDPTHVPPRKFDFDVRKFPKGLPRVFLVVVVGEHKDFEIDRDEVLELNAEGLLAKMQGFERKLRLDKDWTEDVYQYLEKKGVREAVGWSNGDQDCLDALAKKFQAATPGKVSTKGLPTPDGKPSARKTLMTPMQPVDLELIPSPITPSPPGQSDQARRIVQLEAELSALRAGAPGSSKKRQAPDDPSSSSSDSSSSDSSSSDDFQKKKKKGKKTKKKGKKGKKKGKDSLRLSGKSTEARMHEIFRKVMSPDEEEPQTIATFIQHLCDRIPLDSDTDSKTASNAAEILQQLTYAKGDMTCALRLELKPAAGAPPVVAARGEALLTAYLYRHSRDMLVRKIDLQGLAARGMKDHVAPMVQKLVNSMNGNEMRPRGRIHPDQFGPGNKRCEIFGKKTFKDGTPVVCHRCQTPGHFSYECPQAGTKPPPATPEIPATPAPSTSAPKTPPAAPGKKTDG